MNKIAINICIFILFLFFLNHCSNKNKTEVNYKTDINIILQEDTTSIDSLKSISNWFVSKLKVSIKDVNKKRIQKLYEQDWVLSLQDIESDNLGIYQCNVLSNLYANIIKDYGYDSHIIHTSNFPNLCGHAINVVNVKNQYIIIDNWGQQDFLGLDSNTLNYFKFLELTHELKFDKILIKTKTFYTKGKNNELVEQDYYSIAKNWIKTCQALKNDKHYLDVYNDIAYLQLSFPDTFFYKKVLQILDTNYISNDYFNADFLSTQ